MIIFCFLEIYRIFVQSESKNKLLHYDWLLNILSEKHMLTLYKYPNMDICFKSQNSLPG